MARAKPCAYPLVALGRTRRRAALGGARNGGYMRARYLVFRGCDSASAVVGGGPWGLASG